jgi:CHAD domain-containing protein
VAKTFRRLVRRIAALAIDGPSPAWHEARIAAKRARYAADAVAPVLGRDMARLAERLADVTEILGTHQDAHVAQQALRSMADEAPPAAAFALGRLVGVEEAAEMADREAFFTLWPTVAKAARRARVA